MGFIKFSECTQLAAVEFFINDGSDINQAIESAKLVFAQNSRGWDEDFQAQLMFNFDK